MRILAVSDLRVQSINLLEQVAEQVAPDLILYAGDDVQRFGPGPSSWSPLAQRTPFGLAGVIGNDCEREHASAFAQPGCHDLDRHPLLLDGLAVLGLGGAPADEGGGIGLTLYTKREAQAHLERQLAIAAGRPVLLVSHAPPLGTLDTAIRFGVRSIGSSVVRDFAVRACRAVVCGHVHSQGGRARTIGLGCMVVNIASHDNVGAALRYAVLEFSGGSLAVDLRGGGEGRVTGSDGARRPRRIRAPTRNRMLEAGFQSADVFLAANDATVISVFGGDRNAARRVRAQARAIRYGLPVVIEPIPIEDGVIVDVETSVDRKDDPWLVGFMCLGRGRIQQVEELDPARHDRHLQRIGRLLQQLGGRRFLQWGTFDRGALERAHHRVGLEPPVWLERTAWIDVCRWVERVVALPVSSYKVKSIAGYFGYQFSNPELNGMDVGVSYARYRDYGEEFDTKQVRAYNRDDVRAVEHIADPYARSSHRARWSSPKSKGQGVSSLRLRPCGRRAMSGRSSISS